MAVLVASCKAFVEGLGDEYLTTRSSCHGQPSSARFSDTNLIGEFQLSVLDSAT